MIIHYKLCDAADVTIGVTKKMKDDMIRCKDALAAGTAENAGLCKECSWANITFGDEGFCEIEEIRDMVTSK